VVSKRTYPAAQKNLETYTQWEQNVRGRIVYIGGLNELDEEPGEAEPPLATAHRNHCSQEAVGPVQHSSQVNKKNVKGTCGWHCIGRFAPAWRKICTILQPMGTKNRYLKKSTKPC